MQAARPLRGRNGIIGFVPADAFYEQSDLIGIEVMVELRGGTKRPVEVPVRMGELEERLRSREIPGGISQLRQWISERAVNRLTLSDPDLSERIVRAEQMYWICHRPPRREPFLR